MLLIKKGFKPKTHTGVISLFGQEYVLNDSFDRKISKYLSSTQSLREVADMMQLITLMKVLPRIVLIRLNYLWKRLKSFYINIKRMNHILLIMRVNNSKSKK